MPIQQGRSAEINVSICTSYNTTSIYTIYISPLLQMDRMMLVSRLTYCKQSGEWLRHLQQSS